MSNLDPLSPDVIAAAPHLASILASGHYTSVAVYTIHPKPAGHAQAYTAYDPPCDGTYGGGQGNVLLAIIPTKVLMVLPRTGLKYDDPDRHQVVDVVTLVFGKRRDTELQEAMQNACRYEGDAAKARQALSEVEKKQAALAKELADLQAHNERLVKERDDMSRRAGEYRTQASRLEKDLLKVQEHIGRKVFDEAVKG